MFTVCAPSSLSLIDNTEETIEFLSRIIDETKKHHFNETIYLDLSKVTHLTIDAIMYMLAIIKNLRAIYLYHLTFSGNQPNDSQAKTLMQESGFFNFVYSGQAKFIPTSRKIQITTGKIVDGAIAGKVCDFVSSSQSVECENDCIKILYKIIIELMTNTIQHAYLKDQIQLSPGQSWYIFAEDNDKYINFTFLDTGLGIPNTINKNFLENIQSALKVNFNDGQFILSALKGEWRSETLEPNRGKGLPLIYENCINDYLKELKIVSGCGICSFSSNRIFNTSVIKNSIFGTLFSWKIGK